MQHPSLVEKGGEGYIETFHSFIFDVKCILGLPFHSIPGTKKNWLIHFKPKGGIHPMINLFYYKYDLAFDLLTLLLCFNLTFPHLFDTT